MTAIEIAAIAIIAFNVAVLAIWPGLTIAEWTGAGVRRAYRGLLLARAARRATL